MADLDLTGAIEAGASALQISVSGSVFGGSVDQVRRLFADATVRAAAPLIAAQVRAQIAADIEASLTTYAHQTPPDLYERPFTRGMYRAVRIARGDA